MADAAPDFNLKSYLPVLATTYAEGGNQPYEAKVEIISSILNRASSGKKEFGADTGQISKVLETGYSSARDKSPKFMEAMNQKFKDKASEDSFKEGVAILGGILRGTIAKTRSQFILTDSDLKAVKAKKLMNMDLLEETSKEGDFHFFKYKDKPVKSTGKLKIAGSVKTKGKLK
jgi:hypothetical protein